jgi:predicted MFS family arabinose efflux permease
MWFFVHFPTAPSNAGYVLGGATVLYLVSESFRHTTLMVDALSIVPPPSAAIFLAVISLALSLGSASGAVLGGEIMRHYQALSASRPTAIAEALSAIVYVTMGLWIIALILSLRLVSSRVRVAKATHCSADHG